MLARYHRWVFENFQVESVETLREWVIKESQFQTLAHETVEALARGEGHPDHSSRPRAFFIRTMPLNVSNDHAPFTEIIIVLIHNCQLSNKMDVSCRWDLTKHLKFVSKNRDESFLIVVAL